MQSVLQIVSQQKPSTQKFDEHWPGTVHACPGVPL